MTEEFSELDEQQIRSALHGLDTPKGLGERIREQLRRESLSDAATAGPVDPTNTSARLRSTELKADSSRDSESAATAITASEERTAEEQTQSPSVSLAERTGTDRRRSRRNVVALALSLGLAGVLFATYQFTRPLSPERLAEHCLQMAVQLNSVESNWQPPSADNLRDLNAALSGQLLSVDIIGIQDVSGDPFSARCRVWALHSNATRKRLFVFDFQDAKSVQRLHGQMQSIRQASGGWSLVAMRSGDHLLVVAFEGPVDSYLHRPRSA